MKRVVILLTGIFFLGSMLTAVGQEKVMKGKLITKEHAVEYAYLINMRSKKAVMSQTDGRFAINATVGDSLFFRSLGYKDTTYVVNNAMLVGDSVILRVKDLEYALKEVKIRGFMSYAMFKQAFANLRVEDKTKRFKVNIDYGQIAANNHLGSGGLGTGVGVSFGGGLTKDEFKLKMLEASEKRMERYYRVTSPDNIQSFTGLKGTALDSFVVFLRTQYKINPLASEYDMLASVKLAYSDFLAMITVPKDSVR
jgi:hypothetical protein